MDLNFPEPVGDEASVEKVSDFCVEEKRGRDVGEVDRGNSFDGKEEREMEVNEEEKDTAQAEREGNLGVSVSKRTSTRRSSLLATEKIVKLTEEVYEWEYDRSRRGKRKGEKNGDTVLGEHEGESAKGMTPCEDTRVGCETEGEEKKIEDPSAKRKRGRPRKNGESKDIHYGGEAEGESAKGLTPREGTGVRGETEGEKKIEGLSGKKKRGRPRKNDESKGIGYGGEAEAEGESAKGIMPSEDTGVRGETEEVEKKIEGLNGKKKRGRPMKNGESKDIGSVGEAEGESMKRITSSEDTVVRGETEGEEKKIEGLCGKKKCGRPRKNVESKDTCFGGEADRVEQNIEGQISKGRGRKKKNVESKGTDIGVKAEGEEQNIEGQIAKTRRGRPKKNVESSEGGRDLLGDEQNKGVEPMDSKKLEENVNDSYYVADIFYC